MNVPKLSALQPDFLARWARWYPDAPPVGFLLRERYPDRWLRVHTMNDSKRNLTSGWDFGELIRRYNAVATHVLGEECACALVVLHECHKQWDSHVAEGVFPSPLQNLGQLPDPLWDEESGVFAEPMCIAGAATIWNSNAFDRFFSAVAQDRLKGLLVEEHRGQVVAPYDGGADLIFATTWLRDKAKEQFAEWVSPRVDGL